MIVRFEKCELKIDQIHKEEFAKENFAVHEIKVINLICGWLNSDTYFTFKTSGSTGDAKTISIAREKIEYSCKTTMDTLDPNQKFKSALLCINPEMIGGAMVVFRALVRRLDLIVVKPSSNPFHFVNPETTVDLISMVPMQMHNVSTQNLNTFNTILVGGGHYEGENHLDSTARIYSTFGMTETVSHFALKPIGENEFECLGDTVLVEQSDNKLAIKGTLTDHKLLITNDLIEATSANKFKWIGRSDFIINSGGVKINPEEVERKLENQMDRRFIVSFLEDEILQNKVILILEGSPTTYDFSFHHLEKYEKPREIHFVKDFSLTTSQKIDRIKTRNLLVDLLS